MEVSCERRCERRCDLRVEFAREMAAVEDARDLEECVDAVEGAADARRETLGDGGAGRLDVNESL